MGPIGPQGPQGIQGPAGPRGPQGEPGNGSAVDVVRRPPQLPEYFIVAAGILPADPGSPPGNTYNKLVSVAFGDGQVGFTFNGYSLEPEKHQYIVKAMVRSNRQLPNLAIVTFGGFRQDQFLLHVYDPRDQRPVPADLVKQLEFVIEVSQYFLFREG